VRILVAKIDFRQVEHHIELITDIRVEEVHPSFEAAGIAAANLHSSSIVNIGEFEGG
jgi:hypothetical protein